MWGSGAAWTTLAYSHRGTKRVIWRKPRGQNEARLGLGTPPGCGSSRSPGSATIPPAVTMQTRLRVLPVASALGAAGPRAEPLPHRAHGMRPRERRGTACGEEAISPHYLLAGRVDTGSGLLTYSFHILVLQTELPVLGANLVALLVHHLLQLLHHLPLALRHAWGEGGRRDLLVSPSPPPPPWSDPPAPSSGDAPDPRPSPHPIPPHSGRLRPVPSVPLVSPNSSPTQATGPALPFLLTSPGLALLVLVVQASVQPSPPHRGPSFLAPLNEPCPLPPTTTFMIPFFFF